MNWAIFDAMLTQPEIKKRFHALMELNQRVEKKMNKYSQPSSAHHHHEYPPERKPRSPALLRRLEIVILPQGHGTKIRAGEFPHQSRTPLPNRQFRRKTRLRQAANNRSHRKHARTCTATLSIPVHSELNAILRQFNIIARPGVPGARIHQKGGLLYQALGDDGKVGVPRLKQAS